MEARRKWLKDTIRGALCSYSETPPNPCVLPMWTVPKLVGPAVYADEARGRSGS
jgi:hypothetical protein